VRIVGPSPGELVHRAVVLSGLVVRAAVLYAGIALANRGLWRDDPERRAQRLQRFATRYVDVATRFRGGLIKLGQVASLRVEVLPEALTRELARLQDRVPPHPYEEIAARLERELGAPVEERFREFTREPIAAASLGQVHAATALDGRALAVKVLYPGVERSVAVDLAITHVAMFLFDFVTVGDLRHVYRELRRSLRGEMDYLREGRAAEEIARNLAKEPALREHTRVPVIHWDLSTHNVLAMEFLEGVKINDTRAVEAAGHSRDDIVLWASRAFLHMMFHDGFFHCDPHPGNLIVQPDGRIGIIDFGMNERLSSGVLAAIRRNVLASVTRDADLYARSLVEAGAIDERDLDVVVELAEIGFDPQYYNLTPGEMMNLDLGEYFRRVRGHLKRLRSFRLPEGVVMWSRAISVLYAVIVELAPGLRPLDVIGPYVLEFLQGAPAPQSVAAAPTPDVSRVAERVR
jgi:ubiquinone biosynthesis protein